MPVFWNVLAPAYIPNLPPEEWSAACQIRHLMRTYDPFVIDTYRERRARELISKISVDHWEPMFHTQVIVHDDYAPNTHVFEVFSDGAVTSQKGSWAYGHRSVFDVKTGHPFKMCKSIRFPNTCWDGTTFMRTYDPDVAKAMGERIQDMMQRGRLELIDKNV